MDSAGFSRGKAVKGILLGILLGSLFLLSSDGDGAAEQYRFSVGYSAKTFVDVDVKDAAAAITIWGKELAEKRGWPAETHLYKDVEELVRDMKEKKIDIAVMRSLEYLSIKDSLDTSLGLAHLKGGKRTTKYLLLVPSGSAASDVRDLRKKRLAILKQDDIGILFLNTLLLRGKQPEAASFFAALDLKTKPSQAILAVFFGQSDACIVSEHSYKMMSELNPQIKQKLRILVSSPEVVEGLNLFRSGLSEDYKRQVLDEAAHLNDTVRGRQILLLFKLDGVYPVREEELNSLKMLKAEYERLKARK